MNKQCHLPKQMLTVTEIIYSLLKIASVRQSNLSQTPPVFINDWYKFVQRDHKLENVEDFGRNDKVYSSFPRNSDFSTPQWRRRGRHWLCNAKYTTRCHLCFPHLRLLLFGWRQPCRFHFSVSQAKLTSEGEFFCPQFNGLWFLLGIFCHSLRGHLYYGQGRMAARCRRILLYHGKLRLFSHHIVSQYHSRNAGTLRCGQISF